MSGWFIPILVLFFVVDAIVVAWVLRRVLGDRRKLEAEGFVPAEGEAEKLSAIVTELEHSGAEHDVSRVLRLERGRGSIYHCVRSCLRGAGTKGRSTAGRDFLFRLERPSGAPVTLFIKPVKLPSHLAKRVLDRVMTQVCEDSEDLARLELPEELGGSNIFAAAAPTGVTLPSLLDGKQWALLERLGDSGGAFRVACRGDWCSVTVLPGQFVRSFDQLLATVKELASSRATALA